MLRPTPVTDPGNLGCFGNVFLKEFTLRQNQFTEGHTHLYDHVTLVAQGKILVEIEGHEPKEFTAPTYVVIDKNLRHKITSLAERTVYYCIFALRDENGEVIEDLYSEEHDPRKLVHNLMHPSQLEPK